MVHCGGKAYAAQPIGKYGWSIAVGDGVTDAETTIGGHTTITTPVTTANTGNTTIRASSNIMMNIVADDRDPKGAAIAVSVVTYTTQADVEPGATITAGGNLSVQADTTYARRTLARTLTGPEGRLGVAVAVDIAIGNSNA